jgi:hypothetical protein
MQTNAGRWALLGVVVGSVVVRSLRGHGGLPPTAAGAPTAGESQVARPRRLPRAVRAALLLAAVVLVLAAAGWVALWQGVPAVWVGRSEIIALAVFLVFGALLGPGARWLAGERRPLKERERGGLTAKDRLEAVNSARQTLMQSATGLVVITDRYTKAIDQLGATKLDIRLGGIYALERLATDSPRDDRTVYDVLAAFVREHDPKPNVTAKKLPPKPATDIQAALTVIGRRAPGANTFTADLSNLRAPRANLFRTKLPGANLSGADLSGADLFGADLFDADLSGANLSGANLTNADLTNANLSNADLRHVRGISVEQIKHVAKTVKHTQF